jgi:hypothetical protein
VTGPFSARRGQRGLGEHATGYFFALARTIENNPSERALRFAARRSRRRNGHTIPVADVGCIEHPEIASPLVRQVGNDRSAAARTRAHRRCGAAAGRAGAADFAGRDVAHHAGLARGRPLEAL